MLIANLLVVGSLVYVGAKLLVLKLSLRSPAQAPTAFLVPAVAAAYAESAGSPDVETAASARVAGVVETQDALTVQQAAERRYTYVAATSFALAAGGLVFPALNVVSVPLTIYTATPLLESGARALFIEGRLRPALFSAVVGMGALVTEHYLPAAALVWLHHGLLYGRLRFENALSASTAEFSEALVDWATRVTGGAPATVWAVRDWIEVQTPFTELQVGDVIVVGKGEFVPVDGVITSGSATINTIFCNAVSRQFDVDAGDQVQARTYVAEGRIRVQIQRFVQ